MFFSESRTSYYGKKHIPRQQGIPETFPIMGYYPSIGDIPEDAPEILIGMDSGVSNTAFCYIELIKDPQTKAVIDFKYGNSYYFSKEMEHLAYQIDKQFYLMEQYYNLFAHKFVTSLTFELLPLTSIKNSETLKGVIDAQNTTALISFLAYSLNHPYRPISATSIKKCLTGNGKAEKETMCNVAFALTQDERLLANDHMADAFAACFYTFIQRIKSDSVYYHTPIPQKWAGMDWNFKGKNR